MGSRVGIITQARMTSSRLPGKIMLSVAGRPLIAYHLERLLKTGFEVVVATTVNKTDDPLVEFLSAFPVKIFRGDENHVLSRFVYAAREFDLKTIVRVTSDCPLVDPNLIREGVATFESQKSDWVYVSNCLRRTYPRGFDFEVFSQAALEFAFKEAKDQTSIEHVTPFIYRHMDGKIKKIDVESNDVDSQKFRLTVDEKDDFELIRKIVTDFGADKLGWKEIVSILRKHDDLVEINKQVAQKNH